MIDHDELRKPFPPEQIGQLPATQKRPALDYVGHVYVTQRLLQYADGWTLEVLDRFDHGADCWVLARLTIDGVSRDEYGDGNNPKDAIGNALRRCAMRFGIALELWLKEGELDDVDSEAAPAVAAATVSESAPTGEGSGGEGPTPPSITDEQIASMIRRFGTAGKALAAARRSGYKVQTLGELSEQQAQFVMEEE